MAETRVKFMVFYEMTKGKFDKGEMGEGSPHAVSGLSAFRRLMMKIELSTL